MTVEFGLCEIVALPAVTLPPSGLAKPALAKHTDKQKMKKFLAAEGLTVLLLLAIIRSPCLIVYLPYKNIVVQNSI
jgi:hypothetical protein